VEVTGSPGRLLGFDAREDEGRARESLPSDKRQRFSLRPEIERPLSIDKNVWPTYFEYHPEVWELLGRPQPPLIEVDPDCSGGLWLSLERMKRRLSEHSRTACLLAVELFAPEKTTVAEFPSSLIYSQTDPPILPAGSLLLGCDVADAGFISSLSNCGYNEEELGSPFWAYGLYRVA